MILVWATGPGGGGHPLPVDDRHPVIVTMASSAGLFFSGADYDEHKHTTAAVTATGRYLSIYNQSCKKKKKKRL